MIERNFYPCGNDFSVFGGLACRVFMGRIITVVALADDKRNVAGPQL